MYWGDWGTSSIKKASMDGENVTVIVDTDLTSPNSVAIDFGENRLYWIDAFTDK